MQEPDTHAQRLVGLPHLLVITLCKVIARSDDMDALAWDGIKVRRKHYRKRLALTAPHLGNHTLVQSDAAYYLLIEVAYPNNTPRDLPHGSESLSEQLVKKHAFIIEPAKALRHGT